MFYEKLATLCAKRGMTVNGLTNELHFSNTSATKWKRGSVPRYSTLQRIADYFGVDVEYIVDDRYMDYDEWLMEVKGMTRAEVIRPTTWTEEKAPSNESALDDEFMALARQLTPSQMQRVKDFMRGVLS